MSVASSKEFRRNVLAACDGGEGTLAVALRFDCSESWVRRIKQDRRESGKLAPCATRNRTPTWHAWADWLKAKVADRPDAYLRELKAERGVEASETLIARALKGVGITRQKRR